MTNEKRYGPNRILAEMLPYQQQSPLPGLDDTEDAEQTREFGEFKFIHYVPIFEMSSHCWRNSSTALMAQLRVLIVVSKLKSNLDNLG